MKKNKMHLIAVGLLAGSMISLASAQTAKLRKISSAEYRDKMKAGWVGQIAGVCWGGPTEFKWKASVIPAEKCPHGIRK